VAAGPVSLFLFLFLALFLFCNIELTGEMKLRGLHLHISSQHFLHQLWLIPRHWHHFEYATMEMKKFQRKH